MIVQSPIGFASAAARRGGQFFAQLSLQFDTPGVSFAKVYKVIIVPSASTIAPLAAFMACTPAGIGAFAPRPCPCAPTGT